MSDAEMRAQIIPLEDLLAERDDLVQRVAKLRALYGSGGVFDAQRKIALSKAEAIIRGQATLEGTKVTEAFLDAASHTADSYVQFIERATTERAEWILLEERIAGIDFTIQRGQAMARFVSSELGLTPR